VRGLPADGVYRVWIPPDDEGRYVLADGMRSDAGTVRLEAVPGGTIRGRVEAPPDTRMLHPSVQASRADGIGVNASVASDGTFELKGLPQGAWTIRAYAYDGQAMLDAEAEATVGGTVTLRLVRRER
jgi:hypothetical protein